MDKQRWQRICAILDDVLEAPEPERQQRLAHLCDGDDELLQDVLSYMSQDTASENLLGTPMPTRQPIEIGTTLGDYRLVKELGKGGMGIIYLAYHQGELQRKVAIKLLRSTFVSPDLLQRFKNEQQILANLVHPNIAQLYEIGSTPDGLPYFVMEYVDGIPIHHWCRDHAATLKERITLLSKVCTAVAYAHRNLVVHRDIKPQNILVTKDGEPKLLDFGISKILDPARQELTMTALDSRPMTPQYTSPEQVRGEFLTTASDVYSLGVVIYELLSGHKPYHIKTQDIGSLANAICNSRPLAPSQVVRQKDERTRLTLPYSTRKLAAELSGDLDNIILKAMRKEAERRYSSASELQQDLENYRQGYPILARKDSLLYRLKKLLQRHPLATASFTIMMTALLATMVLLFTQWRAATVSEKRAHAEETISQEILAVMTRSFQNANPANTRGRTYSAEDLIVAMEQHLSKESISDRPKAALQTAIADLYTGIGKNKQSLDLVNQALAIHQEPDTWRIRALRIKATIDPNPQQRLESAGEALAIMEEPQANRDYLLLIDTKALTYLKLGQHDLARSTIESLLTIKDQFPPADQITVLNAVVNIYNGLGLQYRSLPLAETSYELTKKYLSPKHKRRVTTANAYGQTLGDLGFHDQAREIYEEALTLVREISHSNSYREASQLGLIAKVARFQRDYDAAIAYASEALSMIHVMNTQSQNLKTQALNTIVSIHLNFGRTKDAMDLLLAYEPELLEGDPNHWSLEHVTRNLSACYRQIGKYDKALEYARKALEHNRKSSGESSPKLARSYLNLSELETEYGNPQTAQTHLNKAWPLVCKFPGAPQSQEIEAMQALIYLKNHRYDLAESHARDIVLTSEASQRPPTWQYTFLFDALYGQGKTKEAEHVFEKLKANLKTLPSPHLRNRYLQAIQETRTRIDNQK